MKHKYMEEYRLVNLETGEVIIDDKHYLEDLDLSAQSALWIKFFNGGIKQLKDLKLSTLCIVTYLYMLLHMSFGNWLFKSQKEIAKSLSLEPSNLHRIIKELTAADLCVKIPKGANNHTGFFINPSVAFRGKNRKTAIQMYYSWTHPNDYEKQNLADQPKANQPETKTAEPTHNSAENPKQNHTTNPSKSKLSIKRTPVFFIRKEDKQIYQILVKTPDSHIRKIPIPHWYKLLMLGQIDVSIFTYQRI